MRSLRHIISAFVATTLFCTTTGISAADISNAHFDDQATLNGTTLVLNGAGIRTKFVFKVYAMGLYLPQKADTLAAIAAINGPRRIEIVTLRDLTADQLNEAMAEGLRKNLSQAEYANLASRIEMLRTMLQSADKVPEKTIVRIDFSGSATVVTVNGVSRGGQIPGKDFFDAIMRIWLGEHPAQEDLKERLLGR